MIFASTCNAHDVHDACMHILSCRYIEHVQHIHVLVACFVTCRTSDFERSGEKVKFKVDAYVGDGRALTIYGHIAHKVNACIARIHAHSFTDVNKSGEACVSIAIIRSSA